jgi:outer membrane protein OmpA-like peptidoglycan-associated protein
LEGGKSAMQTRAVLENRKDITMTINNRVLIALFVVVVLAFPVFAQQTGSTSQDQTSAGLQPIPPPAREGFWGTMYPFARKTYVKRQVEPIRNRINELDQLTAANTAMIKDVDSRAQHGIQLASAKANEADQHAVDAGNRAQAAQQTATQATTRLNTVELVVDHIDQYKETSQTEILFRPGQTVLSQDAKTALDNIATPLANQRGYVIEVQGFSSGQGQAAIAASQKMADSAVRYLVANQNVPLYRTYLVGMGNAPVPVSADDQAKTKRSSGGRVVVKVLKNDLEQLTATSTPPDQGPSN